MMREIFLNFGKQFLLEKEGEKIGKKLKRKIKNVLFCGMGGSGLPGRLLIEILKENPEIKKKEINFSFWQDYFLPKNLKRDTLLITTSYSGNTEETISNFLEGKKRNFEIVALSSGGKLEDLAKKEKKPFLKIPSGFPPRCALGYLFSSIVGLLVGKGILKKNFGKEVFLLKEKLQPKIFEKKGKDLAKKFFQKIPLIYSTSRFKETARIIKIKINENAKLPCFFNIFPELCHNEMTGIGEAKDENFRKIFKVFCLLDKKDFSQNKKRIKIFKKIFEKRKIEVEIFEIIGETFLEKVFNTALLGDWFSFYLAKLQEIDPVPVKLVEEFKELLKK